MRRTADPDSKAVRAKITPAPEAPPAKYRAIQPRRYQRGAFRIPIYIQQGSNRTFGETTDFTPGGLCLFCRNAPGLPPGTALDLTLQFGETGNLNAAAQVAYCLESSHDQTYTIGIRFAGLRDWEQTIILSALKELSESEQSRKASLITIIVSENAVAREVATFTSAPPVASLLPQAPPETVNPIVREAPAPYLLDRRRAPRLAVRVQVGVKFNDTLSKATLHDVSLSGLYLTCNMELTANENQSVQLAFTSDVGVMDIRGTILGIRENGGEHHNGVNPSVLGIAIHYPSLNPTEEKVLASLLEEVRRRPSALKLTVLLVPLETGDLLLEISSTSADPVDVKPIHPGQSHQTDALPFDRRQTTRVSLALPTWLKFSSPDLEQSVQITNLSVAGANVRLLTSPQPEHRQVELKLISPAHVMAGESSFEIRAVAEVVWIFQENAEASGASAGASGSAYRLGLRFIYLDDNGLKCITKLVGRFLTLPLRLEERRAVPSIVSVLLEHHNHRGQRIALYHDYPGTPLSPGAPVVIIAPGYGETKKEYVTLAYYFANNGFHVLRYDHTNHVGESDCDIQNSTLSSMKQDMQAMLDFSKQLWPASPIILVATSLSGRVAIKAAAEDKRIQLLILLAGIVDVQSTLQTVHQEDLVGTYQNGARRGLINVLGFNIDSDSWLEDAVKNGYADLATTMHDTMRVFTPVVFFTAEQDAWVRLESVKEVLASLTKGPKHLYLIPEALHRITENPRKAQSVYRQMLRHCLKEFYPLESSLTVHDPPGRMSWRQSRLERDRARTQHQMGKTEKAEFWRDYLAHFHYIANVTDYWRLLDHIYQLAGPFERDTHILDAGCGNGNFAMFLMINQAYRSRNTVRAKTFPPRYVGIDFVPDALRQARLNVERTAREIHGQMPLANMTQPLIRSSLSLADLNYPLPFRDRQFDRIICNLVLSYLQDPLFALRELMRVLTPGGRLVLTNLKPNADLSQIYRNFVQTSLSREEVEEARLLLNNSGKIKQCESDGIFRFFDRQELIRLLTSAGASHPRVYPVFANQAFIVAAERRS